MPNRILRSTLRLSRRWNSCPETAQVFYIRLFMLADDYGRYEAHPQLLANEAYPYGDHFGDPVQKQTVEALLCCLVDRGLIQTYSANGNSYLQITRWKEYRRSASRFPECPAEQMRSKCIADAVQMISGTSPSSSSSTASNTGTSPSPSSSSGIGDLPAGFPTSEKEATEAGGILPKEFVLKIWNKAMGRGGRDSHDIPIRNFKAYLATENCYANDRLAGTNGQPTANATAELILRQKELERVEAKITSIRNSVESHQDMPREDKEKMQKLKARKIELLRLLGMSV